MCDYEKQVRWIESGKQIGYRLLTENILIEISVQKHNLIYKVFYCYWDTKYDYDDFAKEEYSKFKTINEVIRYIESKGSCLNSLRPLKGNKSFNPDDYHFNS